jgi:acetyltransferase
MIGELRGAALFGAIRGRAARDVNALAETVARISEIAWELRDELLELDINPLFVRAAGEGVVVGDALAVMID